MEHNYIRRYFDEKKRAEKAEAQVAELEARLYGEYKFGFKEGFNKKILMTPKDYKNNYDETYSKKQSKESGE
jgi:hypothetical protein